MLTIADAAPDFELPGIYQDAVRTYTLREMRGRWLVLFFYPADFTFICPTEVSGFSEKASAFRKEGAEILGGIAYPLLSDENKKLCQAYHVLHPKEGVALRATFIIDPEGIIQFSMASHMNVGRNVDETLRVIKALKTGRMCPSDWKPGDPTGDTTHQY